MTRVLGANRAMGWMVLVSVALAAGCGGPAGGPGKAAAGPVALPGPPDKDGWQSVFDSKTLAAWKVTDFGGQGKVHVKGGQIILEVGGGSLTGVTWAGGEIPKMDYEVELDAMRVEGSDFFCGLTVPVRDTAISLICGGWGGTLVGLSSFDGNDAANNETTKFKSFENGRWYQIRMRVTAAKIQAWIDDELVVDAEPGERKIDVRMEVEDSKPFGLAAFQTKAALRNIRLRKIVP